MNGLDSMEKTKYLNWRGKLVNLSRIKKILVVQPKPFGDVLLTSAYLPALRHKFPDAQIDYFVAKPYDRMVYKHPSLDNVVAVNHRPGKWYIIDRLISFWIVFRRRYDLVIDQNCSTTSTQVVALSGARYRLGYDSGQSAMFSNIQTVYGPDKYNAAKRYDMLKPFGIEEEPVKLFFYISPEEHQFAENWIKEHHLKDRRIVLYSPGTTYEYKAWKVDYFAELADMVAERTNLVSVLLAAPDERSYLLKMAEKMKTPALVLPPLTLGQVGAFLKRVAFLFCNDGGLYHLSVATQTPTLGFFGSVETIAWSAQGFVPTHFHLNNPEYQLEPERHFGFTPLDALERFKEIAPQFDIKVRE
ncbi:lipopolysaccharide heptosyltransferase family protein [candidate division KSB1 bacterium]|nr:MAG: lipopolysaccharide heptosyltransferase family protein [candidate division KSB1 bacterium]